MKQMKFFLVALMVVVMGMSVTSCMKGEDNGPQNLSVIARLDYYNSSFKMMDGTKLVPTDPSSIMLLNSGMYIVNGQYNQEDVNVSTASITLTLTSTPTKIDGAAVTSMEQTPDAAIYALDYQNVYPFLFDKNTLIVPAMIWSKGTTNAEVAEDVKKHTVYITYDEIKEGDTELVLNLNDVISEDKTEKREVLTIVHQSYDLASVIAQFDGKLKKITIKAKINGTNNKLDDANYTKDGKFEIDYSKITQ